MNNYEIVLDTSCDLNKENRIKFGIYEDIIRSVVYLPDGSETLADVEWENFKYDEFYKIVSKKVGQVKTAFATFEEFSRVVVPLLKQGKDVMIFVLSSALSGTTNGFRNFADILSDDYPDNKIVVIDTLKYGSASGLLAVYAAENKKKGMSFDENVEWLNKNRHRLHEVGPMDDLRFLAKNGRIAAGKAFFGQLVGVQPIADFTYGGLSMPLGTIKGDAAANKISIEYMKATIENPEDQVIFIGHTNREKRAEMFKEQLLKEMKVKDVVIVPVGQVCGPNIGPGLCAYFYMGKKLTESREDETKLFLSLKEQIK